MTTIPMASATKMTYVDDYNIDDDDVNDDDVNDDDVNDDDVVAIDAGLDHLNHELIFLDG